MIETKISILVNRKTDIEIVKELIISQGIKFPIYIIEYENHFQLTLSSDYEQWEFDSVILNYFPDYKFTSNIANGREEIRLQISRYQSELSKNGWGRPIDNPLRETKYLVKKSSIKPERFNSNVKVLFESEVQDYFINIVNGINKTTKEKVFLLQNEFKAKCNTCEIEILKDKLFETPHDAFQFGYYKLQEIVNEDFKNYIECKRKEINKQQQLPRKIIREFVNSCNKFDEREIYRNLDNNVAFERIVRWQRKINILGIKEFSEYINSINQELCSKDFKIRSSWSFNLPDVTIGVKYYSSKNEQPDNIEQIERITFRIVDNKISSISMQK